MTRRLSTTALLGAAAAVVFAAGCSSGDDSAAPTSTAPATSASSAAGTSSAAVSSTPSPTSTSAQAITPEASFLDSLPGAGVPVRDQESVFGTGQRICAALSSGRSADDAAQVGREEQPWDEQQARTAVKVASSTMCPENAGKGGN